MKSIAEMRQEMTNKAAGDEAFRQALITDPKATVAKEYDMTFPEDITIVVHQDNSTTAHLILTPAQKLSDTELRQVSGMYNGGATPPGGKDSAPY